MRIEGVCSMCGCVLGENKGTEIDDELICDDCAEQHTVECDHCGETVWMEDSVSDERTVLCCSCFDDHYRRCEDCGRILHDNDVLWHNDYPYCESCYDRIDTEIEEYGYKPEPVFYGDGIRFFGVELEIDCGGKDEDAARQIKDMANTRHEHIYCKSDGSLDDGFEIVTHPMTLDYHLHEMPWADVLNEAIRLHYNERMKIRSRQKEGIEAARKRNVRFGRPPSPLPDGWREIMDAVKRGEMRPCDAMKVLGVSRSSFYRILSLF